MKKLSRQTFLKNSGIFLAGSTWLTACGQDATGPLPSPATTATTGLPATNAATIQPAIPPPTTTGPQLVTSAATVNPPANLATVISGDKPTLTPSQPLATAQPATPTRPQTTSTPANPGNSGQPNLDLAAKVGQRMLVVFPGPELTPAIANFLLAVKPGGIVMFADNITSLAQITKLNADLQNLAAKNNLPPFIITLDEEGGIVSRMPVEAREQIAPAQMAQAAGGLDSVRNCAHETALRLLKLGFNLNLAPDADINSNYQNPVIGTRSFGSQPQNVAQAVRAAVSEYRAQGLGCCVKHFPGHGDTAVDSHTGLPVVNRSRAELNQLELVPFIEAISAGTPAIMSGHILFPKIEPNGLPATLSPYFLKQLLRDELKYEGLVITDSLSMGAISSKYGLAEAGRLALKAGADLIIAIGGLNDQLAVFNRLVVAASQGDFEVDQPVARILNFKRNYVKVIATPPENPANLALTGQKAITLLRSDGKSLPLNPASQPVLINFGLAKPSQVEGQPPSTLLGELWREKFPTSPLFEVSLAPVPAEIERINRAAREAGVLVLVTRDAFDTPAQAKLVQSLLNSGPPVIVVAVRGPYDLLAFPQTLNYLTTYSDTPASLRALLAALTGLNPVTGKLPASIPGLYEVGAGLRLG